VIFRTKYSIIPTTSLILLYAVIKSRKLSHCLNSSKIQYQSRRKRTNRYL